MIIILIAFYLGKQLTLFCFVKMSMDFGYLICVTTTQVYVYNIKNVNTPIVTDLRDNSSISLILQSNT
jgi:hypothetical protein